MSRRTGLLTNTWSIGILACLLLLLLCATLSDAWSAPESTIIPIDNLPLTMQNEIQFIEGYFDGIGYIDLSNLVFSISAPATTTTTTRLDVAVVRVPPSICPDPPANLADVTMSCPKSAWMEHVGIGTKVGSVWSWCCEHEPNTSCLPSDHAAHDDDNGAYLIVDEQVMDGAIHHVKAKTGNTTITPIDQAEFEVDKAGYFVIVMANCDWTQGQTVNVSGSVEFVNLQKEIQEMINQEVPFYEAMTLAYIGLFLWYANLMRIHQQSRIRVEEWIVGTMAIGLLEVLVRAIEYLLWQRTEQRNAVWAFFGAAVYGAKHGVFRALLVLLCKGVGVTKANLEAAANRMLIFLTITYVALTTALDFLGYLQDRQSASIKGVYDEDTLQQIMWRIFMAMLMIDIVFLVWIPTALGKTIADLRNSNQERKLVRFTWLWRILCAAVGLTLFLALLVTLDVLAGSGYLSANLDIVKVNEINVFLILLLIAMLWRPNPMAREYAYVMEAATEEDDDLELVESTEVGQDGPDTSYQAYPIESAEAT